MRFAALITIATTVELLALGASVPANTARTGAGMYTITDLGTLPGYSTNAFASAINNRGKIVGGVCCGAYPSVPLAQAVSYARGSLTSLGGLSGYSGSAAGAINNAGYAVGSSSIPGRKPDVIIVEHPRAVAYFAGRVSTLGTLRGDNASYATAVNASGDAIGTSYFDSPNPAVAPNPSIVLFRRDGSVTRLGAGQGIAVNNSGVAVGANLSGQAVIYSQHAAYVLGTLGGPSSNAAAINEFGTVTGYSDLRLNPQGQEIGHAFTYADGRMHDLGIPVGTDPNYTSSQASAINNLGEVVGTYFSLSSIGGSRPFVYTAGAMRDLGALIPIGSGWTLTSANGINDCGDIVGTGLHRGQIRAFVLHLLAPDHITQRRALGCP